jgi:PAS domain-containing protein
VLTIPDIVYRIDQKGHFTFINNAIKRLGYEKEDLIGKNFSEIIYPADIDSVSRDKVLSKIPKNVRPQPPNFLMKDNLEIALLLVLKFDYDPNQVIFQIKVR